MTRAGDHAHSQSPPVVIAPSDLLRLYPLPFLLASSPRLRDGNLPEECSGAPQLKDRWATLLEYPNGLTVAGVRLELTTFGLCLPLRLSSPGLTSLWSGLSLHQRQRAAVVVPAVKSLHLLSACRRAWLGITSFAASPNLTGDHTRISPRAAQCRRNSSCGLSPTSCLCSTPHRLQPTLYAETQIRQIGQRLITGAMQRQSASLARCFLCC